MLVSSSPDSIRLNYVVFHLCKIGRNTLVIGPSGNGQSAIQRSMLSSNSENFLSKYILLSHSTSSESGQDRVFSGLEKRSNDVWGRAMSKKMVAFVDDVNLPAVDVHGSQPALEALRRLLDVAVLYDRQRLPAIGTFDDVYEGLGPSRESPLARLAHFVVIKSLFTYHFFLFAVSFLCRYFARAPKPQANPSSGWTQCA